MEVLSPLKRVLPPELNRLIYYSLPIDVRLENLFSVSNSVPIQEYIRLRTKLHVFAPKIVADSDPIPKTTLEDQLSVLTIDQLWHVYSNGILNKMYCPASPVLSDDYDRIYISNTYQTAFNLLPKSMYTIKDTTTYMDNPIMSLFHRFRTPFESVSYVLTRYRSDPIVVRQRQQIMVAHILANVRLLCTLQTHHTEFDHKMRKMVFDFIIGVSVYTRHPYKEMCEARCVRLTNAVDQYIIGIELDKMKREEIFQSRLAKQLAIKMAKIKKREAAKEARLAEREAIKATQREAKLAERAAKRIERTVNKLSKRPRTGGLI